MAFGVIKSIAIELKHMMDVYGGHPLGFDWYRLLRIYSTLGSKSTSHEKISDIGKELAKLDGKHEAAIRGINAKLDSLINAGTSRLFTGDLSQLKQTIVDGMAGHVNQNADQCAAPVVCDGESVLFTPDVKEILASLVEQKAAVLREVDLQKMAQDIVSIDTKLGVDAARIDDERDIAAGRMKGIGEKQDAIEKNMVTLVAQTDNFKSRFEKGVPLAVDDEAFTNNALGTFFADRGSFSDGDMAALAEAVVEKMGDADNTDIQAFGDALADAVVAKMGTDNNPNTEAFATALTSFLNNRMVTSSENEHAEAMVPILPPEGFNEQLV